MSSCFFHLVEFLVIKEFGFVFCFSWTYSAVKIYNKILNKPYLCIFLITLTEVNTSESGDKVWGGGFPAAVYE